jgi:hypothetical protein
MSRRWWGAAVIVGALLVALIATNISGSRIAGIATTAAVSAAPAVGQCLLADPGDLRSVLDMPDVEVRAGVFGPCNSGSFGEVVWVKNSEASGKVELRTANLLPVDCWQPANDYLGAPEVAHNNDPPVDQPPNWVPAAMRATVRFGPDPAQFASGQAWVACVILPRDAPYQGSVRGERPGPAANAFGSCRVVDSTVAEPYVPCMQPHDSEVFGYVAADPADIPELLATCRRLITAATGLPDITAGGRLSLWVETGAAINDPFRQQSDRGVTQGRCTLTTMAGGRLEASLVGTGNGRLPWA